MSKDILEWNNLFRKKGVELRAFDGMVVYVVKKYISSEMHPDFNWRALRICTSDSVPLLIKERLRVLNVRNDRVGIRPKDKFS